MKLFNKIFISFFILVNINAQDLNLHIQLEKQKYLYGESVYFYFELQNMSNEKISYDASNVLADVNHLIIDSARRKLKLLISSSICGEVPWSYLNTGGKHKAMFDLSWLSGYPESRNVSVTGMYYYMQTGKYTCEIDGNFKFKNAKGEIKNVHLISNAIDFEIVPPETVEDKMIYDTLTSLNILSSYYPSIKSKEKFHGFYAALKRFLNQKIKTQYMPMIVREYTSYNIVLNVDKSEINQQLKENLLFLAEEYSSSFDAIEFLNDKFLGDPSLLNEELTRSISKGKFKDIFWLYDTKYKTEVLK
ncbi:MAG: hypothetical protein HYV28_18465 [Ignavibacteriales bacterium]|nr:hypothetical protein [Ignavibacteriales bacterium]